VDHVTTTSAIHGLLAGIEAGSVPAGVFSEDAILDATVPNWRFSVHGGDAVRTELSRWFADPGRFEDLQRTSLPDGELVEFTLTWEEHRVAHACHQAHILRLRNDQIVADTAFCGGRWPAPLLAEMRAARRPAIA
jgi:hypothetical protein